MAKKTRATIQTEIEQLIHEAEITTLTWADGEISQIIDECLKTISDWIPVIVKETITSDGSRIINISAITNLSRVLAAEYPVDEYPRCLYRVNQIYDGAVEIVIPYETTSGESIYLYCEKPQRLTVTTVLAGAIDQLIAPTGYALGVTTIHIDGLGTGTLYADMTLKITGDTTVYRITADVAIGTNECDVKIDPALVVAVADGVVVTIETSTLTPKLEDVLVVLVAAKLVMRKSIIKIDEFNIAGKDVASSYHNWGQLRYAEAINDLKRMAPPRQSPVGIRG